MSSKWFAPALLLSALIGWGLGTLVPDSAWLSSLTAFIQSSFLLALRMIIAPLIFFSLLHGTMQLRQTGGVGRLGGVTVLYYLLTSAFAIALGLTIVFWLHPWTAYPPLTELPHTAFPDMEVGLIDQTQGSVGQLITNLFASLLANPFSALAETNILGILFCAVLFGLAAAHALPANSKWPLLIGDLTQVIFQVARWIITLLPLGLFAIAFQMSGAFDFETLAALGYFAAVVVGATLIHGLLVLPTIAWFATGIAPWTLIRRISQPLFTAFVTSSSAATLPISMTTAQEKLDVPASKAAFVLPLGATINMDGTALFEGIAVVFLAYMFSVPLDGLAILVVFFVAMLASAGAPGIPSGSMAGLQTVLLAVGIPLEAIALILLIERPLDTIRTAVNVEGDLVGTLVVNKWA